MLLKIRERKIQGATFGAEDVSWVTAVALNGNIVVFGDSIEKSGCKMLSLLTWKWTEIYTPSEFRRHSHCAVAVKDRFMFVYGGFSRESQTYPVGDTIRFDLRTLRWEVIQRSSEGRNGAAAAVLGDTIYRFGGYLRSGKLLSDLHRMPVSSGDASGNLEWEFIEAKGQPAFYSSAMTAHGNSLFVLSGFNSSLYEFRTLDSIWTTIGIVWPMSNQGCVFPVNNRLVILKKRPSGKWRRNFAMFDVEERGWMPLVKDDGLDGGAVRVEAPEEGFEGKCAGTICNGRIIMLTDHPSLKCFEISLENRKYRRQKHPPKSREEFGRALWEEMPCSDVKFVVEGTEIQAHRIMCWEYPYFRSLFSHETEEARTGEVNIRGVSAALFQEILRYVYTGKFDIEFSSSAADTNNTEHCAFLVEMMAASDRFLIEGLKDGVEDALIDLLDDANCDFLIAAGCRYNAPELAEAAGDRAVHRDAVVDGEV